eukprot:g2110.t1
MSTPFEIRVSDEALADLKRRLANTRWPDTAVPNDDWSYGAPTAYIKELAQFWQDCDWRAQEDYLNGGLGCGAKHYKIKIDGLSLHYCHAPAKGGSGVPLPPADVQAELAKSFSEHDKQGLAARAEYDLNDAGYSKIQGTKPQTIGTALNDSPAGLLAWIVEKLRTWADNDGNVENCFSKMDMVTNVSFYWFGEAATSSARLYKEGSFGGNEKRVDELAAKASTTVITVPYGFAFFPHEIFWPPKSFIDKSYTDVRRYEIMPRGGHFAAWEQPELMVEQIKAFFLEDVDSPTLCGIKAGRSRL